MIEVIAYSDDRRSAVAECDDPEAALLAARTLWDEAWLGRMGEKRSLVFLVDGKHVRTLRRRP